MADPPLDAGAVQDTTDWALALDVAVTAVGAPGVVAGMAPVHALGGAFSPYAGVALVDDLFGANRVNLVSGGTAMSFSNRALGVAGELRVGAQLLLGKGLTLSAEGEGAGGARVVGGGGRLMARLAW